MLTLALLLLFSFNNMSGLNASEPLHVSSPEWRDQIIYFLVTDRFYDGDSSNNDQGAGEYDPSDGKKYSGGDIEGIIKKIPYIKKMGATAIWITPVVASQWWDPWSGFSGYHGYWATNFKEVDKHLGTLDTYRGLSTELHKNGLYLIQDIVCNHTGNFFRYNAQYSASDPAKGFELNTGSKPVYKPTQYPFNFNDARNAKDREMNIYHWTPDIVDYKDKKQKLTYQMFGLDDINTDNKLVRTALKDSYNFWIREAGVDGYRMDTATYVDHGFWFDFLNSKKDKGMGVIPYAKTHGKNDFLIFAETWVNAEHNSPVADIEAAKFFGTKAKPEFNSVINFSLQNYIEKVFGRGEPTSYLTYRLDSVKHYPSAYRLLNFVDNHDMGRFLASYREDNFVQALAFIMTIPGIPVIYYGSEQGFTEVRGSMFEDGFGSGGKDHFNTDSELFIVLRDLIKIRKDNDVFRRGTIKVLKDSKIGAGVFAYEMKYRDNSAVVIFNTSNEKMLLDNMQTDIPHGTVMRSLFSYNAGDEDIIVGASDKISLILAPLSAKIIISSSKNDIGKYISNIEIDNFKAGANVNKNYALKGRADVDAPLLILDGDLKSTVKAVPSDVKASLDVSSMDGKAWSVDVPVDNLMNGEHSLVMVSLDDKDNVRAISKSYSFMVYKPFIKLAEYSDPIGDDKGPKGTYSYPTHPTFKGGYMDIEKVTLYSSGNNMKVAIKMANPISTAWNPKNGFDHVVFDIYVGLPGNKGAEDMPFQNSKIKDNMKWDYMVLLAGWNNAIYKSIGSGATNFGTPTGPAPEISVDAKNRTINVFISAKSLGFPKEIKGSKIYITTWDYDGMEAKYRPLSPEPEPFVFGGGKSKEDPIIMDDTAILEMN
jgi:glycosidase